VASLDGKTAIAAGFSGILKIFTREDSLNSEWSENYQIYGIALYIPDELNTIAKLSRTEKVQSLGNMC
jgi:hypothetical protein